MTTSLAPQRIFGSPVYASLNTEYAYLPSRSVNDGVVTHDDSHGRFDMTPTLRAPLSRLTFLSVNTSANYRATYYSRSAGPTGGTVSDPYFRGDHVDAHRRRRAGLYTDLGSTDERVRRAPEARRGAGVQRQHDEPDRRLREDAGRQ